MTNEELVRWAAEKVMGWEWQFSCYVDEDGKFVMWDKDWLPITNPAHWMMVVERMRELGFDIEIYSIDKSKEKSG